MANDLKVCVQNLSAYNNGELRFAWLDLPMESEDLQAAVAGILAQGGGEEVMIADSEGFPFRVGEYDNLERLSAWAEALEDHDRIEAFTAYCENIHADAGSDPSGTIRDFEEAYIGSYDSRAHFAEEYLGENLDVPEHLAFYIDWDKYGRDALLDGFWESNGHYFYNH